MKRFKTLRTFLYHAHGFAISGMISSPSRTSSQLRPWRHCLPPAASPKPTVTDFRYKDIVSFKRAYTRITGMPQ